MKGMDFRFHDEVGVFECQGIGQATECPLSVKHPYTCLRFIVQRQVKGHLLAGDDIGCRQINIVKNIYDRLTGNRYGVFEFKSLYIDR